MDKIKLPIALASVYLFVYTMLAQFQATQFIAPVLFILSPLVVIWMVVRVLKDGTPSKHTFSERFYEDYDYTPLKDKQP